MKWRTTFEGGGACLIDDRHTEVQMFNGTLDRYAMLYVVPAEQLLGADFDLEALEVSESHEQASAVMTKGE